MAGILEQVGGDLEGAEVGFVAGADHVAGAHADRLAPVEQGEAQTPALRHDGDIAGHQSAQPAFVIDGRAERDRDAVSQIEKSLRIRAQHPHPRTGRSPRSAPRPAAVLPSSANPELNTTADGPRHPRTAGDLGTRAGTMTAARSTGPGTARCSGRPATLRHSGGEGSSARSARDNDAGAGSAGAGPTSGSDPRMRR